MPPLPPPCGPDLRRLRADVLPVAVGAAAAPRAPLLARLPARRPERAFLGRGRPRRWRRLLALDRPDGSGRLRPVRAARSRGGRHPRRLHPGPRRGPGGPRRAPALRRAALRAPRPLDAHPGRRRRPDAPGRRPRPPLAPHLGDGGDDPRAVRGGRCPAAGAGGGIRPLDRADVPPPARGVVAARRGRAAIDPYGTAGVGGRAGPRPAHRRHPGRASPPRCVPWWPRKGTRPGRPSRCGRVSPRRPSAATGRRPSRWPDS